MSEITAFFERVKAVGPLEPGEESIKDWYDEYDEELPEVHGLDLSQVPASLYHDLQAALAEHQELLQEEAEKQAEYNHEYSKGQAQAQGMRDAHDPAAQHQAFVRDLPPATRRKVQRVDSLRQKIHDAAAWADLKRLQAERSGSGYVADKLMEEVHRLEFQARLDAEELEEIQEGGFESFKEDQNSAALQSEQQLLTVFDRPAGSVPLSHVDEKISEANRSSAPSGYARRGNDQLFRVSVEGQPIGTAFERLRNDGRSEDVPDHELLLNAAERGLGGYKYHVELIKDVPSQQPEPVVEESTDTADIEVVNITGPGAPEVSHHDEEEPKPETDRTPKPKTNIHTFM